MKKVLLLFTIVGLLTSCNMNPSKEARIQKLEDEVEITIDKIEELENEIEVIETKNKQLEARILELEKR